MKRLLAFLFCFLACLCVYGQVHRPEKRISLVDVTASMEGRGVFPSENIFGAVKSKLVLSISNLTSDDVEIVIVPFTDKPHAPIVGTSADKEKIINQIELLGIQRGDTNIADAWSVGEELIDSTKVNYLFLLTDGLHNCGPEKEELYSRLKNWADVSGGKYYFAFYVMLTPDAKEAEIADIVENTAQMWLIQSMDVNVTFINTDLRLTSNVNQNHNVSVSFSTNHPEIVKSGLDFDVKLEDNDYYSISSQMLNHDTMVLTFTLWEKKPRLEIPVEMDLDLRVQYDKSKFPLVFFTPENIQFDIVNRGVRTMTIREL